MRIIKKIPWPQKVDTSREVCKPRYFMFILLRAQYSIYSPPDFHIYHLMGLFVYLFKIVYGMIDERLKGECRIGKFLIDHERKLIHRSAYVTDKCQHESIPVKYREDLNSDERLNQFQGYELCPHCSVNLAYVHK